MAIQIVCETHSWSEDNEAGLASGWRHSRLSARGRELAAELGARRRDDGIQAVFCSDLKRAAETAEIAFAGADIPILLDWRLRECDYGDLNGMPSNRLHLHRDRYLDEPYPGGESWRAAVIRVTGFLQALQPRWSNARVLVIGHVATRWALDIALAGAALDHLMDAEFAWREGWEYRWDDSVESSVR